MLFFNVDSRKMLEPLEVLGNSNQKGSKVIQENIEEETFPNYIYRIRRTDIWACKNCKIKDDIWFMKEPPCNNIKNNSNNK